MELTVAGQTWSFLYSLLLGMGLGLFYDVFRILRIALPHRTIAVAIEDIFYWTSAAFLTFFFFFYTDGGRIRIYLLTGEAIGFLLYYFTLGAVIIGAAKRIIAALRWIFHWIYRLLIHPVLFVMGWILGFLGAAWEAARNFVKNSLKISNKHLKKYHQILYNEAENRLRSKLLKKGRGKNEKGKGPQEP